MSFPCKLHGNETMKILPPRTFVRQQSLSFVLHNCCLTQGFSGVRVCVMNVLGLQVAWLELPILLLVLLFAVVSALIVVRLLVVRYVAHTPLKACGQNRKPQPYSYVPPQREPRSRVSHRESFHAARSAAPTLESPRAVARGLVGLKLGTEQALKAAEKIVQLRPFVQGRSCTKEQIWGFFDLPPTRFREEDVMTMQAKLKTKLNRMRLLLHPDKNCHPDAEQTFKFLEQCHGRLVNVRQRETVRERTMREEHEFREGELRRRQQHVEREMCEERRAKEEERRLRRSNLQTFGTWFVADFLRCPLLRGSC